MATIVISPDPSLVGRSITIFGEGFAASTPVAVRIDSEGFFGEIASDGGGLISNDDISDYASATLTLAANVANAETVTIGSRVYTFKTVLAAAGDVLVGASASASLDNLKAAVNGSAGEGSTYGTGTVAHADVLASEKTATTLKFLARLAGTDANALTSTETLAGVGNQFGGATFTGGAGDPTGYKRLDWRPTKEGTYTVIATDGTNVATAKAHVFLSA